MLYIRFVRTIRKQDPSFDEELVDRALEPSEARNDLRKRGHIRSSPSEYKPMLEYRGFLYDSGIKHPRVQNFVMKQEKETKQEDLDLLAYVLGARPHRNLKMDIARKARTARSVRQYARNPNRYDIPVRKF